MGNSWRSINFPLRLNSEPSQHPFSFFRLSNQYFNRPISPIFSSECFGLLGVNGAGKTTTFKMLTGDVKISSGEGFVRGISLKNNMPNVHKVIGYCPQFDALIEDMTGRETLEMFALLRGVRKRDINATSMRLATELNFMKHIDKKVCEYSGGNKRKLSTAVALLGNPSVVYLDEPTTGIFYFILARIF